MIPAFWDAYAALRGVAPQGDGCSPEEHPRYDSAFLSEYAYAQLLPFWERHAADAEYGGFVTHLRRDGSWYQTRKVSAMQGRMAYAFAAAARARRSPVHSRLAAHAAGFMRERLWDAQEGGWFTCVQRDGTPEDTRKATFQQAYAIVGLAEYALASGDERAAALVRASYDLTKTFLWDRARGGYYLACDAHWNLRSSRKTVCSQLDMLLAALMLHQLTGERRYVDDAVQLADLIVRHMCDRRLHTLLETCRADWRYDALATRDVIWFGHNLKGAWELLQVYDLTRSERHRDAAQRIIEYCIRYGYDAHHGGFFHYGYRSGRLASREKLWWTNCEALMALSLADRVNGVRRYSGYVNRTLDFCLRAFADPFYGEWYRSCTSDGRPIHTNKGGGDKAAYHTVQAFLNTAAYLA